MLGIFLRKDRARVTQLSARLAHNRQQLQTLTRRYHEQCDQALRSDWVLPGAFAAGCLAGGVLGGRGRRWLLKLLPLSKLAFLALQKTLK